MIFYKLPDPWGGYTITKSRSRDGYIEKHLNLHNLDRKIDYIKYIKLQYLSS